MLEGQAAEVANGDAAERQRRRALHVFAGRLALQSACKAEDMRFHGAQLLSIPIVSTISGLCCVLFVTGRALQHRIRVANFRHLIPVHGCNAALFSVFRRDYRSMSRLVSVELRSGHL